MNLLKKRGREETLEYSALNSIKRSETTRVATTGRRPRVPPCDEDDDDVEDDDEDDEKNVFANERTLRRDMGELKRKEE